MIDWVIIASAFVFGVACWIVAIVMGWTFVRLLVGCA